MIIERTDDIPIEFEGRIIGQAIRSGSGGSTSVWIYETAMGYYVAHIRKEQPGKEGFSYAEAFTKIAHVADWLRADTGRPGMGKASLDAYKQALDTLGLPSKEHVP